MEKTINQPQDLKKRIYTGSVVSDKMDKTVTVKVERTYTHPIYKKIIRVFKKYKVHDENNSAKIGDLVEFYETRPLSKTKYMTLARIVDAKSAI